MYFRSETCCIVGPCKASSTPQRALVFRAVSCITFKNAEIHGRAEEMADILVNRCALYEESSANSLILRLLGLELYDLVRAKYKRYDWCVRSEVSALGPEGCVFPSILEITKC